jgi:hypothetical protein
MSVTKDELFCLRLPLLDVREQAPEDPAVFRLFDLYLVRSQAEYLVYLVKELEAELFAAPQPEPPGAGEEGG